MLFRYLFFCLLLIAVPVAGGELYPVEFVYETDRDATRVCLAGAFNQWNPDSFPMIKEKNGVWSLTLDLPMGYYAYKFVVDGQWREDPKAARTRPDGLGGRNSVVAVGPIEEAERRCRVPKWVVDAVFYQVFPERFHNGNRRNDPPGSEPWGGAPKYWNFFGGDLQGVREKLEELQQLGITALYLNPVFEAPSNHKYDTQDYRRVDPHFGGDRALLALIRDAHERGMKVVLDGVFNHTATSFFAFEDARRRGRESEYWNWYFFHGDGVRLDPPNYDCWSGFASLPELNTGNPEVRAYLFESVRLWMKAGVDGWRLDTGTDIEHEFWEELREVVKGVEPEAFLLGELWGDPWPWVQGDEFDGATNYRFREAVLKGVLERSIDVEELDRRLEGIREDCSSNSVRAMMNLLGSHDTPRLATLARKAAGKEASARIRQAVLLQLVFPGAPCVYYGDEVGLEGEGDPDCRRCYPWDPAEQDRERLEWHRRLIALRGEYEALRGLAWTTLQAREGLYVFRRGEGRMGIVIAMNLTSGPKELVLDRRAAGWRAGSRVRERLGQKGLASRGFRVGSKGLRVTLPANAAVMLSAGRR